jgi:DivIVA domain-containing protein
VAVGEEGIEPEGRGAVPPDVRDVSFPHSRRGYDRGAVDAYVERVNGLIDELEAARSPEAAVKQALREVGEKTSNILEQAGQTAEEVTLDARQNAEAETARARKEADDLVANAKKEADDLLARGRTEAEAMRAQAQAEAEANLQRTEEEVTRLKEEAEARLRELQADTGVVRTERRELVNDISELAERVERAAQGADERFPPPEAADSAEEPMPETESTAGTDGNKVASKPARTPRTRQ